jgi:hypothetical protein
MPPKPFLRRNSLKLPAGKQIQCLYGPFNEGTSVSDNINMAQRIVYNYGDIQNMQVGLFNGEGDIQMTDSDNKACTGMICLFGNRGSSKNHFIPYVKIGDTWYNGDDENGYLRKRDGPPTKDSKFVDDRGTRDASSYVKSALIFYYDTNAIQHPRTNEDWTGRLLFGQLGTSCGPDAIQTVLLFADGYYERFNLEIYNNIKQYIDPRFSFKGVTENPYVKGELEEQKSILEEKIVEYSTYKKTGLVAGPVSTNFLLYMFIRYYAIDTSPALEFTPENNSARNGVPESNAKAYYNALEYVKTHNESNSNYATSWKFIKSFAKLYPDWLPPSYHVKKEFETLLRKVYDAYDKTPSGTARLNRVLFFIYANLFVDELELVQRKKMLKYYEVFDKYGEEYKEEHKNEGDIDYSFDKKSYRMLLELYKFFEENFSIIMKNLGDFQDVFNKTRNSQQGGNKRKTRRISHSKKRTRKR